MSSPFPGMDPYLEGHLWPDVHHRLATEISRRLTPRLKPRYVARLEIYVVEDTEPEAEIGIMYPDVEVLTADRRRPLSSQGGAPSGEAIAEAPMTVSLAPPEVRVANVEVRDATSNKLVTGIEILSPVNKRGKGLEAYRKKRERLRKASVHVLEIDLLRRGERSLASTLPRVPDTPYRITLIRAGADVAQVWPLRLQDKLPTVPVPLRPPDEDVPLELGPALSTMYDEAAYELSVDYRRDPPPPPLAAEDVEWMTTMVKIEPSV